MSTTEHFAHTMSLLDHPSDPMVMLFEVGLTPAFRAQGFDGGHFRRATLRLFERFEKLRFSLRVEVPGFKPVLDSAARAAELNEHAWSRDALPVDDFRRQSIPFEEAPLLRFKYEPRAGFFVACHHSLMDGFGCYELAYEIFKELAPVPETALAYVPPSPGLGARLLARWVGLADELRRSAEIGKHPTTHLAPTAPVNGQRHHFATADVPLAELKQARTALREDVTLNDVILAAFHLTLEEFAGLRQTPGRLSVLVPINMRPRYANNPRFVNRMGYVSVSTLPAHRKTPSDVLRRVHEQMTRAKRFGKEDMVERIMGLYEKLGIMKRVRREWLKTRLPSRFTGPDKFFWKNFDTATVTNMGKLVVPEAYAGWISRMVAFAPVMTPSISLAILGREGAVTFGLRFGESVLSEEQGNEFLRAFVTRLTGLERTALKALKAA